MRTLLENKWFVVLISILTLGVMVWLGQGLHDLPFREGQSFAMGADRLREIPLQNTGGMSGFPLGMIVSMWTIVAFVLIFIGLLLTPEWRKRFFRIVLRVGLTYWALFIVFTRLREIWADMGANPAEININGPASDSAGAALPAFASPQTINIATYIVSVGLALLLIYTGWKLYALWKEMKNLPAQPLKKIAQIARASIDDLTAGRESTDVIMNCYYRMSDVVSDKKHLERSASMTPGEFAARLENAGLPPEAVRRLTRLFEGVRYGNRRSSPGEVKEAVASLTAIIQFCGESA
jgi:hypothetical protein